MSFDPIISPSAAEDLVALPIQVQNVVEQEINRLAADPVRLSRRAVSPPYPAGQMYQFEHDFEDVRYLITVLFRYGQDERTVEIFAIGRQTQRII